MDTNRAQPLSRGDGCALLVSNHQNKHVLNLIQGIVQFFCLKYPTNFRENISLNCLTYLTEVSEHKVSTSPLLSGCALLVSNHQNKKF